MDHVNPQKSEVHEATEDSTSSPANAEQVKQNNPDAPIVPGNELPDRTFEEKEKTFPDNVRLRRDESDVGGPIQIEIDEETP